MLFKKKLHQTESHQITKEISIEARKEQIKNFIKKYKKPISYVSIAILLLLIIIIAFSAYQKSQEEKYSAILQQVLIATEKNNNDEAKKLLKQLYENTSVPSGIKSLASLKYAATLLNEEKLDEASVVYLEINKNKKFDSYVRELAGLLALKSMVDANNKAFDDKIISLLADLEKNSKILKYFIIEQKAVFEWNGGNFDKAGEIFKDLANNPEASQTIKARAKEMSDIYSSKYTSKETVEDKKIEAEAKK